MKSNTIKLDEPPLLPLAERILVPQVNEKLLLDKLADKRADLHGIIVLQIIWLACAGAFYLILGLLCSLMVIIGLAHLLS